MSKKMLSWKINKEKKDRLIGRYVFPFAIPFGLVLISIIVILSSRYGKAEKFFKGLLRKWENLKNG